MISEEIKSLLNVEDKSNVIKTSTFPTMCIDGFYEDPKSVIEWATSLNYHQSPDGSWPGWRSDPLDFYDTDFANDFCKRLFGTFFNYEYEYIQWEILTHFQIIKPFDIKKEDPKNYGWIHQDNDIYDYAGVIYLTPNADLDTGTSIFRLKNETVDKTQKGKKELFMGEPVDNDDYIKNILEARSQFEEITRYNNVFNRLICFESNNYHGANNFKMNDDQLRLTQIFFIKVTNKSSNPLLRGLQ